MNTLKKISISLGFILVLAWLFYSFYMAYQLPIDRIQGQIEAQQYSVSSKVAGRINKILVRKGDIVARDQLIFTMLSPEIEAKLAQATAAERAAEAMKQQAESGARKQEIAAAESQWQKAKAGRELMEKTYQRLNNLYQDGVLSEQKRDEAFTQMKAAQYTEKSAYQLYQMAREGARTEIKKAASEKEQMAAGAVAEVQAYVAETRVKSWHTGEVANILLQEGELAPQGFPVVTIVDMNDAWAVFHIKEIELPNYAINTKLNVKIPALGDKTFSFQVSHISVMGEFATWKATSNNQGFDVRTFEIEARPSQAILGLRVGMTMVVE
jgi:HlyD family secretion protein